MRILHSFSRAGASKYEALDILDKSDILSGDKDFTLEKDIAFPLQILLNSDQKDGENEATGMMKFVQATVLLSMIFGMAKNAKADPTSIVCWPGNILASMQESSDEAAKGAIFISSVASCNLKTVNNVFKEIRFNPSWKDSDGYNVFHAASLNIGLPEVVFLFKDHMDLLKEKDRFGVTAIDRIKKTNTVAYHYIEQIYAD